VTIDEVGNAAAFMLSDLASGITGEIMYVDGGMNTTALGNAEPLPGLSQRCGRPAGNDMKNADRLNSGRRLFSRLGGNGPSPGPRLTGPWPPARPC
jgi:hypothetical protein